MKALRRQNEVLGIKSRKDIIFIFLIFYAEITEGYKPENFVAQLSRKELVLSSTICLGT